MMEGNEEEEEDDDSYPMFPEYGDAADNEDNEAEDQEAPDELLMMILAQNGVTDSGFGKLLAIMKRKLPRGNELPASTYEAKKVVCPLGLDVQKIHACINDRILYRGEYENLDACPVCTALRYKIRRDDPGDVEGERPRKRVPAKVMWQVTVSRSSAEAEYRAVAHVVAETVWLRQLLSELHRPIDQATIVYCDNISAVYMSGNPVQHRGTKHIEIDIHFVREKVALGQVRVLHVPTSAQFADIFTKGLATTPFQDIRFSLNVVEPTVDTAGDVRI
ncbi:hypothetical protein QYE76_030125 [Lolium multiflorum]|uniref:Uncharacterized protein n=1 Tax=Lolium multiflorum TaxID=4521 RepID=A0AAD8VG71_LOLMU|nr:hypothetical protein QYE76_030125 [Lolium multiflorum]